MSLTKRYLEEAQGADYAVTVYEPVTLRQCLARIESLTRQTATQAGRINALEARITDLESRLSYSGRKCHCGAHLTGDEIEISQQEGLTAPLCRRCISPLTNYS